METRIQRPNLSLMTRKTPHQRQFSEDPSVSGLYRLSPSTSETCLNLKLDRVITESSNNSSKMSSPQSTLRSHKEQAKPISLVIIEKYFSDICHSISCKDSIDKPLLAKASTMQEVLKDCLNAVPDMSLQFYVLMGSALKEIQQIHMNPDENLHKAVAKKLVQIANMIEENRYTSESDRVNTQPSEDITEIHGLRNLAGELMLRVNRVTARILNLWKKIFSNQREGTVVSLGFLLFYCEVDSSIKILPNARIPVGKVGDIMRNYINNPGHVVTVIRKTRDYVDKEMISVETIRRIHDLLGKVTPDEVKNMDKTMTGFAIYDLVVSAVNYYKEYASEHYSIDIFDDIFQETEKNEDKKAKETQKKNQKVIGKAEICKEKEEFNNKVEENQESGWIFDGLRKAEEGKPRKINEPEVEIHDIRSSTQKFYEKVSSRPDCPIFKPPEKEVYSKSKQSKESLSENRVITLSQRSPEKEIPSACEKRTLKEKQEVPKRNRKVQDIENLEILAQGKRVPEREIHEISIQPNKPISEFKSPEPEVSAKEEKDQPLIPRIKKAHHSPEKFQKPIAAPVVNPVQTHSKSKSTLYSPNKSNPSIRDFPPERKSPSKAALANPQKIESNSSPAKSIDPSNDQLKSSTTALKAKGKTSSRSLACIPATQNEMSEEIQYQQYIEEKLRHFLIDKLQQETSVLMHKGLEPVDIKYVNEVTASRFRKIWLEEFESSTGKLKFDLLEKLAEESFFKGEVIRAQRQLDIIQKFLNN